MRYTLRKYEIMHLGMASLVKETKVVPLIVVGVN